MKVPTTTTVLWTVLFYSTGYADRTITIPSTPSGASGPISPSFCGFAFEERSFFYFAGSSDDPNTFSQNLVDAVANRTNTSPRIRVGGTSLDHGHYTADQKQAVKLPDGQGGGGVPKDLSIGPYFFKSIAKILANFPVQPMSSTFLLS